MSKLHLTARQQRQLHDQLRTARTARLYRRTLALVEAAQGKPIAHIARSLGVSRRSLYHWQQRYTAHHDPAALVDRKGSGHPSVWTSQLRALLEQSLEQKPDHYGYQASEWTVPLLIEHLATRSGQRVSDSTVRRQLRRMGYVWKRPRYVLQPDPAREKKARSAPAAAAAGAPRRGALRGRN
jgi:transposase